MLRRCMSRPRHSIFRRQCSILELVLALDLYMVITTIVGGNFMPQRPLRFLLLYVVVIFIGAALLAPWVYWLAQAAGTHSAALAKIGAQPFHRYVNRCLLVLAILGCWPFLRSIGANSWPAVGLVKTSEKWRRLAAGFALGFGSLALVALLATAAGGRNLNSDYPATAFLSKFVSAGLSAVVVGFLEELLFRGALFGALRKTHGWIVALFVSSAVYALVHFFQKPASPAEITWTSGLELLPRMLRGFAEVEMLVPGFFTLLLAGIILALAYHRTGSLYLSIGLHAGWIFWLKFYGVVTIAAPDARPWFWGSAKLIDGWLALGILVPVLLLVCLIPLKKDTVSDAA